MKAVKTPPIMGAAIRFMTSAPVPVDLLMGISPMNKKINDRKRAEKLLREARKNSERPVKERIEELEIRATHIEELNTALKVLLRQREHDKKDIENNLLDSIKISFCRILKNSNLSAGRKIYTEIMESNIDEMVSPFARELSSSYFNLTPTEILSANLVKQENTTGEIAEMFNLSESAIIYHRRNIRKELSPH